MRHASPAACVILLAGCAVSSASRSSVPEPTPFTTDSGAPAAASPALPAVPLVLGPLAPKVVYPTANQLIQSRDSNFIFGSIGNGRANLTIDGTAVRVLPNGSFIAFLPNPSLSRPSYELVAALGADTVRLTHPVRILPPVPRLLPAGRLVVDSSSVTPAGGRIALRDDEPVRVSVRAPANATVEWRDAGGARATLVSGATLPTRRASGELASGTVSSRYVGDPERFATDLPARDLRARTELVISRGADTVRLALPAIAPAPDPGRWGILGADSSVVGDTDRVVVGRPTPGGTYKWLLLPGTAVRVTGWSGSFARVRLDDALEAWVSDSDVRIFPDGWSPARRVAGNSRIVPAREWVDLVIPMASRPPFLVEEGDHELALTLYGVAGDADIINYAQNDSLIRDVSWAPVTTDRVRFTLRLSSQPYGYLAFWDSGRFVLRVRRPPRVNHDRPLAGLTIAVDAGHPPIGATGPTGLYEAEAVLAVAERARAMLTERGANVVMTRTTPAPVELAARPIIARRANANAIVSIHLNALPDGVNPFNAHGTGAYFFHPQSAPLARALQNGMVRHMGLRDLGIYYDNLAMARPTWMPAVLCEGAFIMIPEQEAALRTPEFQSAYARGIVDGLENYFRGLAGSR